MNNSQNDNQEESIVAPGERPEDLSFDYSLRPRSLAEYVGQEKIKVNLEISLAAAKKRNETIEHILLHGAPGLGKTTLAYIIANEMGVNIRTTSGPAIEKSGDLAAILTNLNENDILFIDEIHRLNKAVEEILYPAMEDHALDIIMGKGPSARTIRLPLPHFTLIGATTQASLLSAPLRDRFGFSHHLDFYEPEEIERIIHRSAKLLNLELAPEAAQAIAKRARRTPRIANRLLKRVRDYCQVKSDGQLDQNTCLDAFGLLELDDLGLDSVDRKILKTMVEKFGGGPVGLNALAAASGEEMDTVENLYEPYWLQLGFIDRTPRGRVITDLGRKHLGYPAIGQTNLL